MKSVSSTFDLSAYSEDYYQIIHINEEKSFVCVNIPVFTFIPSSLYIHKDAKEYFKLLYDLSDEYKILENQFESIPYHVLFPVRQDIIKIMEEKNSARKFFHYVYLLGSRLLKEEYQESSCVLINKQASYFYLFICKNKNILLLNSFNTVDDQNISYFTLNGLHTNKINLKDTCLFYSGIKNINDQYINILSKYIPRVEELSAAKYGYFNDIPDDF